MTSLTKSLVILIPLSISPYAYSQDGEGGASGSVHYEQAAELTLGMSFINGQFVATHTLPTYAFDITDLTAVQAAMDGIVNLRRSFSQEPSPQSREYAKTIEGILAAGAQGLESFPPEVAQAFVDGELESMMAAIDTARNSLDTWEWPELMNSLVKVMELDGYQTGEVADFLISNLMSGTVPEYKKQMLDWVVNLPPQQTLHQPTGENANLTPLLSRVYKLESPDTLAALFGTPETTGIVPGTATTSQKVFVRVNNSVTQYFWSSANNRWSRTGLGSTDATNYSVPIGSYVYLGPAP